MMPNDYRERILLVMLGTSPNIITELLYALLIQNDSPDDSHEPDPFKPTQIRIITTSKGQGLVREYLTNPENGQLKKLSDEYDLSIDLDIPDEHIHIIIDEDGNPLDDVMYPHQVNATADFVLRTVTELIAEDNALHVCLSGGRKTMTYYIGVVMSLVGRDQDRLSHILISDALLFQPSIFYKPREPVEIEFRGEKYSTADMEVILADVPFVRLRGKLSKEREDITFNELVERTQKNYDPPKLVLTIESKKERYVQAGGQRIKPSWRETKLKDPYIWSPKQFVLLFWMAQRCLDNKGYINNDYKYDRREYGVLFNNIMGTDRNEDQYMESSGKKKSDSFELIGGFQPWINHIQSSFAKTLGEKNAQPYSVSHGDIVGAGRAEYALTLNAEQIEIIDKIGIK